MPQCKQKTARQETRESVGGNDELRVGIAAHAHDRTGGASANGIGVATWVFGRDGNRAIRAADDGAIVVKGVVLAEINDKTRVLGTSGESDGGADLNAEGFVGLGVRDTRFRGGGVASAAPDIDGARRGSGAAGVGLGANACLIGHRANVIFDFLFGFLADDEASHEKRQDE